MREHDRESNPLADLADKILLADISQGGLHGITDDSLSLRANCCYRLAAAMFREGLKWPSEDDPKEGKTPG